MIPNVLRFWRGSDLPAHSMDELRFISGQGERASQTGMDQNGSIKRSTRPRKGPDRLFGGLFM